MDASSTQDAGPTWYIGLDDDSTVSEANWAVLHAAQDANYDMLTVPITTNAYREQVESLLMTHNDALNKESALAQLPMPLVPPLKPAHTNIFPNDSIAQYLAKTSSWIDLASSDPVVADVSRQVFNSEIAYAAFCGIQNVIVHSPFLPGRSCHSGGLARFARCIQEALAVGGYLHISVVMPITAEGVDRTQELAHLSRYARSHQAPGANRAAQDPWMPWEAWNTIRSLCKYNTRVSLALKFTRNLPAEAILSRWFSEPLRLLMISGTSYLANKHGQPVLSKGQQNLLSRLMRLRFTPWLLINGVGSIPSTEGSSYSGADAATGANTATNFTNSSDFPSIAQSSESRYSKSIRSDPTPHLSYLRYLQKNQPPKTIIEKFGSGYQDFLQAPLQPLADNLESITYEVFEKDPIKYDWYERAIMHALLDWASESKPVSSTTGAVVIAVCGSGRGPLVTRALRAAKLAQVQVEVWAVEKNANAYVFLQRNNDTIWDGKVTVVKSDMRAWKGPLRPDGSYGSVDIIVSELLGSFADNELSPECLDGVQHVLHPTHGISIPASYTAHLTPIATPRIHADILGKSVADDNAFETPYVVMLHQYDDLSVTTSVAAQQEDWKNLSGEAMSSSTSQTDLTQTIPNVQTCWEFKHPLDPRILEQAALRRSSGTSGGTGGANGGDGVNEHNTRFTSLTFPCVNRGVCHGLAGYFETVLYATTSAHPDPATLDDGTEEDMDPSELNGMTMSAIELSTNPVTMDAKSKDMISWFPIFFPLKVPVSFPDRSELVVNMWRLTDDRKVWFEWVVESFAVLPGGERIKLGMTDLHSSKKNACLM